MDNMDLDWAYFKNSKKHFEIYNTQSSLLSNSFTHLSNRFPQSRLKAIFTKSKGSKVSKGYNLGGFPYQVLDLIRDFDKKDGFNIRLLAWWGHGVYLFLTYGYAFANSKHAILELLQPEFQLANPDLLFNYPKLIESNELSMVSAIENQILDKKVIQLWKPINLCQDSSQTEMELENLLGRLLDIHN